jgi:uncharacterized protein YodC (DUF2158 family)
MSSTYSIGDIVKLKSGGPEMTIKKINADLNGTFSGHYQCQWFAGKKLDLGNFPQESLVAVTEE